MNEQTGATGIAESIDPTRDPSIERRRIDALQRALRARQVLEREAERAARLGAADTGPPTDVEPATRGDTTPVDEEYDRDVERLVEIHRALRHERRVARRPFHRHAERLVLALELAERLALERLGFDDYADFETRRDDRPNQVVIDLNRIERAQRELAEAEAVLTELGTASTDAPVISLPTWTIDPVLRRHDHERPTRARRSIFGATDHARGRWSPPADDPVVRPLPMRLARVTAESRRRDREDRPPSPSDRVLGEVVHDGRVLRVTQIGGLSYDDDAITYGDPTRPE